MRVIVSFGFIGVDPDSPVADEIIESLVIDTEQWQLEYGASYVCVDDAVADNDVDKEEEA
jgi:hypothetical protein